MPANVKPVPEGYHTVTPYLTLNDAAGAIEFYKRAFGAKEIMRMNGPGGKIGHAEVKIGDSVVMLSDEMPGSACRSPKAVGGSTAGIFLYVEDVDALYNQAISAGANAHMPPADMFWGDRFGTVTDPYGHVWSMATHKEDIAPEEMEKRGREAMAQMAQRAQSGD